MPRPYALVEIKDVEDFKKQYQSDIFDGEKVFIYLGEIPNMPDHHVVAGYRNGKIYSGFHDIFVETE